MGCFKSSFGKPPKKSNSQTAVVNLETDKENIPTQNAIEGHSNLASNNERSHKMMWKLPDKCFENKCEVCRNNSCCSFRG